MVTRHGSIESAKLELRVALVTESGLMPPLASRNYGLSPGRKGGRHEFSASVPRVHPGLLAIIRRLFRRSLMPKQLPFIREELLMQNLYVGNLPENTTETELRNAFAVYGQVDSVRIITDRQTGRSRGFAFVEMADSGSAEKAVAALNASDLGGRTIQVTEARPKAERPRGGQPFGAGRGPREPRW